ncbi:MAG: SDR family NAD(P)-dependent oxidoreductase [Planctomycetota bacterium]|nr:SDR family NAD(P)-dependent oxidoreductase [Planctomycetota bacterium]
MSGEFADRHVVVTGGTGALGSAVVGGLLERGAVCHVPVLDEKELDSFAHAGHERVRIVTNVDLADEEAAGSFFAGAPSVWASLHIAGGFAMGAFEKISLDAYRKMMDMNATTCFLCCREAVKRMRESGAGGRIVNVSAGPAIHPAGGMVAYSTSKAAVASITQCVAAEVRDEGIWVNAVIPSIMDTPANREAMPSADHAKWPKTGEVAETMLFLASPRNAVTTGALVPVAGRT